MKFNQTFITGTLQEAADHLATRIAQNYTLNQVAEAGSCTIEESQNIYELAFRILTEGSEDLIPENLELPDATDDVDPMAAKDAEIDADVAAASGGEEEDFNIEDLEGIILPDSEGNQYIVQGGILLPYGEEEDNSAAVMEDPEAAAPEDQIAENTVVDESNADEAQITENTADVNPEISPIEENTFASHSSIISSLIQNTQFK
jgi:hypothetical protein